MLKQPHLFYSKSSTLPKEAFAKFYISTTFGLSFMIRSVAPTRSSTFYAYLITKIGNSNLKQQFLGMSPLLPFLGAQKPKMRVSLLKVAIDKPFFARYSKSVCKVCTISFERPVNYLCDAWHVFPPKYKAWTHFNMP